MRPPLFINMLIVASITVGCQSGPQDRSASGADTPPPTDVGTGGRPVAYIDGKALTRDELHRFLVEAQGGEMLAELLLDRAVNNRLAEQGITLTDADFAAERQRVLDTLSADSDQATLLLNEMRGQRGLGELRFEAMLRRNAGLRRLVRDQIRVGDEAIKQAYDLRFGQRFRVRLITSDRAQTLGLARQRALGGESFTELAILLSTDESSAQGGLLSPINPADPTYPKAIRDALPKLNTDSIAGRLSPVIALPEGYALLWLEGVISKDAPPLEQVREELKRAVRLELERVRMQQLAQVLLVQANVIVLDPALNNSWQRQREAIGAR